MESSRHVRLVLTVLNLTYVLSGSTFSKAMGTEDGTIATF